MNEPAPHQSRLGNSRGRQEAMEKIAVIILAAGPSSRLGRPKQLLELEGQSLIERALDAANGTGGEPVIVVVGANYGQIVTRIRNSRAEIVRNVSWKNGLGSSIRAGIKRLLKKDPAASAVLLMVGDQPLVRAGHLRRLIDFRRRTGKHLVCSRYAETVGVPAVFGREFFGELMRLGKRGAKRLLLSHSDQCAQITLPEAEIDIDEDADIERLESRKRGVTSAHSKQP
jgi:molybdenum cofactor cytidylyltransferase